jgi:hypothetical protein
MLVAAHCYEYIDAWFGRISQQTRKHIATLDSCRELTSNCSTLECAFDESFIFRDYKSKLDSLMGSGFQNYSKGPEAMHQLWFQAVEVNDALPFGVKTMERHYCGEEYPIIVRDESKLCNLNYQRRK